ncbi:MAG: MMPL family transporter, partial [Chloroflexota bacterium]|nr:MMPL family transporter [Chloroflexota bacterium]
MFGAWGRFVYRSRWLVLLASLALVAASVWGIVTLATSLETSDEGDRGMEAARAYQLMRDELPARGSAATFQLIFTANDPNLKATDPAFGRVVEAALAPLRGDPRVERVETSPNFVSRDGRRAFATVTLRGEFDDAQKEYESVRERVHSDSLAIIATGNLPLNHAFTEVSERDLQRAEFIGLPLALVVLILVFGMVLWRLLRRASLSRAGLALALTFGTLALALVPILVGLFTIAGGVAGIFALARSRDMSIYALNIASMIGLGLAIDYSLFIISRFLEEVDRRPVGAAIERTMATTGKAIAFSGMTVAIGVAGLLFYRSAMLNSMGLAAMLVVGAAVLYGLTFLPALLSVTGNGITALARRRAAHAPRPTPHAPRREAVGFWHTLAGAVMRRPWLTLLPLLALLLLAGSPFLRLRLGLTDPTVLPERIESRQGWELLTKEFPGADNTTIPVVIGYADGRPLTAERIGRLYDYSRWLADLPGVARVQSPFTLPGPDGRPLPKEGVVALLTGPREALPEELRAGLGQSVGEHIAVLRVLTPLAADSDAARDLVRRIRASEASGAPETGGERLVAGDTGLILDVTRGIRDDSRLAIGFIMVATYVVLFLLLGSVLLPLKAVLMNVLSITASYGALVWIFQEGNLSGLLGFTPGAIDPTVPVLMFCLLFGLSMDYEVLLLSRMKEEWDRTGDNAFAVAEGLEQTGRLITGAAAIMIFVFGAFALAELTLIKSIGLGMALAVAVDALIVRTLIVPATMRLLGDLNWWAPAPLARLGRR